MRSIFQSSLLDVASTRELSTSTWAIFVNRTAASKTAAAFFKRNHARKLLHKHALDLFATVADEQRLPWVRRFAGSFHLGYNLLLFRAVHALLSIVIWLHFFLIKARQHVLSTHAARLDLHPACRTLYAVPCAAG